MHTQRRAKARVRRLRFQISVGREVSQKGAVTSRPDYWVRSTVPDFFLNLGLKPVDFGAI